MDHGALCRARVGRRPDVKWRIIPGFDLHWRRWGEERVLYHTGSGDTHLVDEFGANVLEVLETGESKPVQLCRRLSQIMGVGLTKDLLERVRTLLDQFHRVGLVEPVRR